MTNKQFNKNYDVFRSFLVENADYEGYIELPKIKTSNIIPKNLVPFSKAMSRSWKDFDCFVMFYEHDVKFERLWHNPKQYLEKLKKFKGIISPDFSLYRNMPLCMQMWIHTEGEHYRHGYRITALKSYQMYDLTMNVHMNFALTELKNLKPLR